MKQNRLPHCQLCGIPIFRSHYDATFSPLDRHRHILISVFMIQRLTVYFKRNFRFSNITFFKNCHKVYLTTVKKRKTTVKSILLLSVATSTVTPIIITTMIMTISFIDIFAYCVGLVIRITT